MWRFFGARFLSNHCSPVTEMTIRSKNLRIDNFITKTSSLSRSKCELAIKSALIGVDGVPVLKPSHQIYPGIVIDYIKSSENGLLKLMRWQNVEIEEVETSKPNGTKYEITFDVIKAMEIPSAEYQENVKNAIEIERQVLISAQSNK